MTFNQNKLHWVGLVNENIHKLPPQKLLKKKNCEDNSEKIFPIESKCTTEKFEQKYHDLVCDGQVYKGSDDEEICNNITAWIQEKTTDDYLDPHGCQSSCKTPHYGCQACTNEEYSFQCVRNGTKVCLHPELQCDGHPQCDQSEDEDLASCQKTYFDQKIIEQYATYICYSAMYPNMKTIATVCNGVTECHDGSDEDCSHGQLSQLLLWTTLGGVLVLYLGFKSSTIIYNTIFDVKEQRSLETDYVFNLQKVKYNHEDQEAFETLNNFLLHSVQSQKVQKIREICKIGWHSLTLSQDCLTR